MEQEYLATVGSGSPSPAGALGPSGVFALPSAIVMFGLAGLVGFFVATPAAIALAHVFASSRKSFRHINNS